MNEETYRKSPNNLEIEQALLGAILVNNFAMEKVSDFLEPQHFYEEVHGRIYDAISKLLERGQSADPGKLKTYFENDEALKDVGGAGYLVRLAGSATTIINAEGYGRTIYDLSLRRDLINIGEEIVLNAFDSPIDQPATNQIEHAEQELFNLSESSNTGEGFENLSKLSTISLANIERAYKDPHALTGKTTGLDTLDESFGGLHDTDLIILAGRPAMGKSSLALNIAFNTAKRFQKDHHEGIEHEYNKGAVVGFFSLEMSGDQLTNRLLSDVSGIDSNKLRQGKLTSEEFQKVARAAKEIENVPLHIDSTPSLSIAALRTRARRLKRQKGLGMVIVDYLQLMQGSGGQQNRVNEISEITRGLKSLAKELNIPVIALSQLSRTLENRPNKRPILSDLRESGSIEQDADIVMFVYREEYYHSKEAPDEDSADYPKWQKKKDELHGVAEVIVGKNRHGRTDIIKLHFEHGLTKFSDLAQPDFLPEQRG